ncbi:MAG TPA: DUF1990 domain-containing protein [Pyrinomonadaceae bacterium]|jgi:uncharacterized protein (UPF0548 family)
MFLRRKPSEDVVGQFISSQQDLPFSYAEVGATQTKPPAGFTVDHNRIKLGKGEETYRRATAALQTWQQFDLGWMTVMPRGKRLDVGTTVAVQANIYGLWSLNAARIVYVIDERQTQSSKFGFAYGTLPDHVERGEERFMVEWQADDAVWYDIYAFSRPRHMLARIGFPITRLLQKRFVRDSLAAMKAVADDFPAD